MRTLPRTGEAVLHKASEKMKFISTAWLAKVRDERLELEARFKQLCSSIHEKSFNTPSSHHFTPRQNAKEDHRRATETDFVRALPSYSDDSSSIEM